MPQFSNADTIKRLYTQPLKEKIMPHLQIDAPNVLHQIDILHFTNDDGQKYLLTIVDVHNSIGDARAMPDKTMTMVGHALDDIYQKSDVFNTPNCIQADQAFNNPEFIRWCNHNSINYKFSEAYAHRQNSFIERFNQSLGTILWKIQVDKEISDGKPNTEWVKYYKDAVKEINEGKVVKKIPKKKNADAPVFNDKSKYVIQEGTNVRLVLNHPETIQGKKLQGTIRSADHKWRYNPTYVVEQFYLMPNNPPLYRIKQSNGKIYDHLVTNEQLQII